MVRGHHHHNVGADDFLYEYNKYNPRGYHHHHGNDNERNMVIHNDDDCEAKSDDDDIFVGPWYDHDDYSLNRYGPRNHVHD